VPHDVAVPKSLQGIVDHKVSWRPVTRQWDELNRVAASMVTGWCSATLALERFGSAAQGNPTYEAAISLGKILRTVYLCDYFALPPFRKENLSLLNQGESSHILQRAIHQGSIGPKHGRSNEQLEAISGALSLLCNVVMAFNTHRLQELVNADPASHPEKLLRHIAPNAHGHINFRGTLAFGLGPYKAKLLRTPTANRLKSKR